MGVASGGSPTFATTKIHDSKESGVYAWENAAGFFKKCDIYGNTLAGVAIKKGANPAFEGCTIRHGKASGVDLSYLDPDSGERYVPYVIEPAAGVDRAMLVFLLDGYAEDAAPRGIRVLIAGASGAAHLPGMLASKTLVPVLGVPVPSKYLRGEDSLYSIVQMPKGIPVATFAIGEAGAANAGLFAAAMIAANDPIVAKKLAAFRAKQTDTARAMRLPPTT